MSASPPARVLVAGSRQLSTQGAALVRRLAAVWAAGSALAVCGDAVGVDYIFARAAVDFGAGHRLSVSLVKPFEQQSFLWRSVLRPSGFSQPSVLSLSASASRAPFRARLAIRSMACVSACSSAWVVLSSPSSRGSLATAASVAALGRSVVVFPLFEGEPPLLGAGVAAPFGSLRVPSGSWQPVSVAGVASGFRWVAQPSLFPLSNLK